MALLFFRNEVLSVESPNPGIALLGVDIVGFVLDVMITLDVFPVRILSLEDLPYTCFKDQCRMKSGYL